MTVITLHTETLTSGRTFTTTPKDLGTIVDDGTVWAVSSSGNVSILLMEGSIDGQKWVPLTLAAGINTAKRVLGLNDVTTDQFMSVHFQWIRVQVTAPVGDLSVNFAYNSVPSPSPFPAGGTFTFD